MPRPNNSCVYHFCTYFDANYLLRGVALHRSLSRTAGEFRMYVLCLDAEAFQTLERMKLQGVVPVALEELEQADPELHATKASRSRVEYYFTCTAAFLAYLLRRFPDIDRLVYLDADLYFYSSPAPLFQESADASVAIIEHRFPAHLRHLEVFGHFNVGLLVFANDPVGRECIAWWRARCIEWCHDRLEDGKFADQKYLDDWPTRFPRVHVLRHRGANVAPWNLAGHAIAEGEDGPTVDGEPLIFYHFHKMKRLAGGLFEAGVSDRRASLAGVVRRSIYAPYLRELRGLMRQAGTANLGSVRRAAGGPLDVARRLVDGRAYWLMGNALLLVDLAPLAAPFRRARRLFRGRR